MGKDNYFIVTSFLHLLVNSYNALLYILCLSLQLMIPYLALLNTKIDSCSSRIRVRFCYLGLLSLQE